MALMLVPPVAESSLKINPTLIERVVGKNPGACYNKHMEYQFSLGWLFGGIAIAIAGGLIVFFYKPISDNLVNGVSSYERVKLVGVITIIIGLICTANLHTFILEGIVKLLFGH
jgi:hypothetical protein